MEAGSTPPLVRSNLSNSVAAVCMGCIVQDDEKHTSYDASLLLANQDSFDGEDLALIPYVMTCDDQGCDDEADSKACETKDCNFCCKPEVAPSGGESQVEVAKVQSACFHNGNEANCDTECASAWQGMSVQGSAESDVVGETGYNAIYDLECLRNFDASGGILDEIGSYAGGIGGARIPCPEFITSVQSCPKHTKKRKLLCNYKPCCMVVTDGSDKSWH